ncbi:metacaspase-1 [Coprinopsis sp. MPI-PUGE-AT-0042]|nr:metacaspase-1 [Coprinopsis sp. MPI-PUGE-AT-0042]
MSRSSRQPVSLDLSKQRLFIHPDSTLPKFYPVPKAVMVTPVYDYDGPMPSPPASPLDDENREALYMYGFNVAHGTQSRQRNKLQRRCSSYSPGRGPSERRDYDPTPQPETYGHPSRQAFYPPGGSSSGGTLYRSRPSTDPLAQNPPDYQIQATGVGGIAHSGGSRRPGVSPIAYDDSQASTPEREWAMRSRPAHDPIAQNPPDYQILATGQAGVGSGHAHHPYSAPAYVVSHSVGGRPVPSSGSPYHQHGREHVKNKRKFDAFVQEYLQRIPLDPEFCLSRCTGGKRAVCIGINYVGQQDELKGCANDARAMRDWLINEHHFHPSNIILMTDDDKHNKLPTRKAIFEACMWLAQGAKRDDSLFMHYSGHGGQSPDASGREADGMDETIFPVDFDSEGDIIDDVRVIDPSFSSYRVLNVRM